MLIFWSTGPTKPILTLIWMVGGVTLPPTVGFPLIAQKR